MENRFGQWLLRQIARENLNLSGLAAKMGLSQPSVSDWVHGKSGPRPKHCGKLAEVLHVPIEDVYRALGRIPDDEEWSEDLRRIAGKFRGLTEGDRQIVENLVDNLAARQERPPPQQ